jgi:RimJ/RimL family protein N-acetyltransferase
MRLKTHDVTLQAGDLTLRPLTEEDWDLLCKWNGDPEVLYYAEGDDVAAYSLEQVQGIYREISQSAHCFIIEWQQRPIGDCWLQGMNLDRILREYPDRDCRRIDLMIGEKEFWGQGIGPSVIRLLTACAFDTQGSDMVFGCGIGDYNPRSLGAFRNAGFVVRDKVRQPEGRKATFCCDLVLDREGYRRQTAAGSQPK